MFRDEHGTDVGLDVFIQFGGLAVRFLVLSEEIEQFDLVEQGKAEAVGIVFPAQPFYMFLFIESWSGQAAAVCGKPL